MFINQFCVTPCPEAVLLSLVNDIVSIFPKCLSLDTSSEGSTQDRARR